MHVYIQTSSGTESSHTVRLQGRLHKQDVLMLVDSDSSSNFISGALERQLQGTKNAHIALPIRPVLARTLGREFWLVAQPNKSMSQHGFSLCVSGISYLA